MRRPGEADVAKATPAPGGRQATRCVAMVVYHGIIPLDVVGPLQVFGLINLMQGRTSYDVKTVAEDRTPIETGMGFALVPSNTIADLELPVDTLLVAGADSPTAGSSPALLAWLRQAAPQARRFGSICTGTFTLGAAGLLEGKRVTTHWGYAERLAQRFPGASVEPDSIYIRDGNLYSSAGITAGIDLALALVEEDFGRDYALEVARHLVLYFKRSGGQSQFSTLLRGAFSETPAIARVQQWCVDNLAGDLSVAAMADQAAMSERNFARLFREQAGRTPADYVAAVRLDAARRLLEETQLPVDTIAARCGLGSSAALRRLFMGRLGVTPQHYRTRFASTAQTH